MATLRGGLAWLLPLTILVMLLLSSVAGYYLYKAVTYRSPAQQEEEAQGKDGVPTIEENRVSIDRPVYWNVTMKDLPDGAKVYVEGELHKERPVVLQGNKSPYAFRIEAPGYVTWEQGVVVNSDLGLKVRMLTPEEAAALAAAPKAKKKPKDESTASGPAEVDFSQGGDTGEQEAIKKKKKGKLEPTSPGMEKLKKLL